MAASAGAPCPVGAIRPVDGAPFGAQRSLHEIPLVGAYHVLWHPHKVTGRSIAVLIGEGEKHSIPADGAVLGGIALGAPGAQERGVRHRTLRRRHSRCAGCLQLEARYGHSDRDRGNCCHSCVSGYRHELVHFGVSRPAGFGKQQLGILCTKPPRRILIALRIV